MEVKVALCTGHGCSQKGSRDTGPAPGVPVRAVAQFFNGTSSELPFPPGREMHGHSS